MAVVDGFYKLAGRDGKRHPTVLECGYFVFDDPVHGRVMQLDTFGSTERKLGQKQSQTLQLSQKAAAELIAVLLETFPGAAP